MPIKKKLSSSHDVQKYFYRRFWSKNFPTLVSTVWRTLIESPGSPPTGLQGDTSCQKSKLAQLLQAGAFSGLLVFSKITHSANIWAPVSLSVQKHRAHTMIVTRRLLMLFWMTPNHKPTAPLSYFYPLCSFISWSTSVYLTNNTAD